MRLAGTGGAIAAALLVVALAWSPGAGAAFPGRDGRLMWVESMFEGTEPGFDNRSGSQFFVFQSRLKGETFDDTGDLVCDDRDPSGPCPYLHPSFSPDGRTVLLEAHRALDPDAPPPRRAGDPMPPRRPVLALVGANEQSGGSRLVPLPDLTEADRQPAWSPDGRRIVFSGEVDGNRDLYVVERDGSGLRRLTSGPKLDREPVWSTRGEIAFVRGRVLYRVRADGSGLKRLDRAGRTPDWSPDGRRLVFSHARRLFQMRHDGRDHGRVTRRGLGMYPAWSPTGGRIAFRRERAIFTVGHRGRGLRRVPSAGCCLPKMDAPRDIDWGPRQR